MSWNSLGAFCVAAAVLAGAVVARADGPAPAACVSVTYIQSGTPEMMDIYTPPETKDALPAVVYIHGGGWMEGSRAHSETAAQHFNSQGYVFCAIDYRFSTVAPYPAQIEDCKCAIRFLRANAAKYHIDPKHIGVWGDSAGGHLVSLVGLTPNVKRLEGNGGWSKQSSAAQAVLDWCGPSDITPAGLATYTSDYARNMVNKLLGDPKNEKLAADASPITFVSKDAPPFLIMHGDKDEIVPLSQSQKLYDALKGAGADATLQIVAGAGHGGPQFVSPENVALVDGFFARTLKAMKPK